MQNTITDITQTITDILNEMIEMYEMPKVSISPDTYLSASLGFTSIDMMHVLASVDMRFETHLPYDNLIMKNGEYISDLSVGEIAAFVEENLQNASIEPKKMA